MAQATEEEKGNSNSKPATYETIYAGSIHLLNTSKKYPHPHQCILFLSTSKDELIPPTTVASVTYQMHPTQDNKQGYEKTFYDSPFLWSINVYGTFEWMITVDFNENTEPTRDFNKSNFSNSSDAYIPKRNSIGGKLDDTKGRHTLSLTETVAITGIDPILRNYTVDGETGDSKIAMPHFKHSNLFDFIKNKELVGYLQALMKEDKLKQVSEMSAQAQSKLFFRKTQNELSKTLLKKGNTNIVFKGYNGRVKDVLKMFNKSADDSKNDNTEDSKDITKCKNIYEILCILDYDVLSTIAKYIVFDMNTPVTMIAFDEAIEITECEHCDINLLSIDKFKELTVKYCNDVNIRFNQTVTKQCEIMKSKNIHIERLMVAGKPSGFRLQNSQECTCEFKDDLNEVAFTTHGCQGVKFIAHINTEVFPNEVQKKEIEIPKDIDGNTSIFTKWRHSQNEAEFTMKGWKPHYTLGRIARG